MCTACWVAGRTTCDVFHDNKNVSQALESLSQYTQSQEGGMLMLQDENLYFNLEHDTTAVFSRGGWGNFVAMLLIFFKCKLNNKITSLYLKIAKKLLK